MLFPDANSSDILEKTTANLMHMLRKHNIGLRYYYDPADNSYYLKLDDGMLYAVRISDHEDPHSAYRYDIGPHVKQCSRVFEDNFVRYLYPADRIYNLILDILREKQEKIDRYGLDKYIRHRAVIVRSKQNLRGFWVNSIKIL